MCVLFRPHQPTRLIRSPVVEQLFERAHEYANLSNRAGAIATDLILACSEFNMPPEAFRTVKAKTRKRARSTYYKHSARCLLLKYP